MSISKWMLHRLKSSFILWFVVPLQGKEVIDHFAIINDLLTSDFYVSVYVTNKIYNDPSFAKQRKGTFFQQKFL